MSNDKHKKRRAKTKPPRHTHLRDLPYIHFTEHKVDARFIDFIEKRILPTLPLGGYKIRQKQKIAIQCILNLYSADLKDCVVVDNRDGSKNTLRIGVWDAIEDAGFCIICKGIAGKKREIKNYLSRYRSTGALVDILQGHKGSLLDYDLKRNSQRKQPTEHAPVTLHTGTTDLETGEKLPPSERRKLIPFSQLPEPEQKTFKGYEDIMANINVDNKKHSWQAGEGEDTFEPNMCLRITNSGYLHGYMRVVQWSELSVQSLPKQQRQQILIDGEPVTELDYSGFDIRRLYNYKGIDPDRSADIYRPELILPKFYASDIKYKKITRKFVKKATLILLNTKSKKEAGLAVGYQLRTHAQKRLLYRILYETEGLKHPTTEIIERIIQAHPDIYHCFFGCTTTGNHFVPIGSWLMTEGAKIMIDMLNEFRAADKPAVSIHDAVVCKRKDGRFGYKMMQDAYMRRCNGFRPVIKREF